MYYDDGSVYEGEWFNDMKNGQGMLRLGIDCYYILDTFFTITKSTYFNVYSVIFSQ